MEIVGISILQIRTVNVISTVQLYIPMKSIITVLMAAEVVLEWERKQSMLAANDISDLEIGMEIEIFYDKAVVTAKGTFQTVKKIVVL